MEDIEHEVKLRIQNAEKKYQKEIAILQQKVELLNIQLQESKEREINSKKAYSKLLQTLNEMESHTKDATIRKLEKEIMRLRNNKMNDTEILKNRCDEIVSMVQSSIKKDFEFFSSKRNSLVNELMKVENEKSAKKEESEEINKAHLESLIKKTKRIKREQKELEDQNRELVKMINKLESQIKTEKIVNANKIKDMETLRENEIKGFERLKLNLEKQIQDYKEKYHNTVIEMKKMLRGTHGEQQKIMDKINELISCGSVAYHSNLESDKSPNKHHMLSPKMIDAINRNFHPRNTQFNPHFAKIKVENIGLIFSYQGNEKSFVKERSNVFVPKLEKLEELSKKMSNADLAHQAMIPKSEEMKKSQLDDYCFQTDYEKSTKTERLPETNNLSIFQHQTQIMSNNVPSKQDSKRLDTGRNFMPGVNPTHTTSVQSQISSQYCLFREESQYGQSRREVSESNISGVIGFENHTESLKNASKSSDYICKNLNDVFDDFSAQENRSTMLKRNIEKVEIKPEEEGFACRDTPRLRGELQNKTKILTFAKGKKEKESYLKNDEAHEKEDEEVKDIGNEVDMPNSNRELLKEFNSSKKEEGDIQRDVSVDEMEKIGFGESSFYIEGVSGRENESLIQGEKDQKIEDYFDSGKKSLEEEDKRVDQHNGGIDRISEEKYEWNESQEEGEIEEEMDGRCLERYIEEEDGDDQEEEPKERKTVYKNLKGNFPEENQIFNQEKKFNEISNQETHIFKEEEYSNHIKKSPEEITSENNNQNNNQDKNNSIKDFELDCIDLRLNQKNELKDSSKNLKEVKQVKINLNFQSTEIPFQQKGDFPPMNLKDFESEQTKQEILFNLTDTLKLEEGKLGAGIQKIMNSLDQGTTKTFEVSNSKANQQENQGEEGLENSIGSKIFNTIETEKNFKSETKDNNLSSPAPRSNSDTKHPKKNSSESKKKMTKKGMLIIDGNSKMGFAEKNQTKYDESDSEIRHVPITTDKKDKILNAYLNNKTSKFAENATILKSPNTQSKRKSKSKLLIITNDDIYQHNTNTKKKFPEIKVNYVESNGKLPDTQVQSKNHNSNKSRSKLHPLDRLQSIEIEAFDSMPPYNFESCKTSPKMLGIPNTRNNPIKKENKKIQNFEDLLKQQKLSKQEREENPVEEDLDDYNVMNDSQRSNEGLELEENYFKSRKNQQRRTDTQDNSMFETQDDQANFSRNTFSEMLKKNQKTGEDERESLKERIYRKVYNSIKKKGKKGTNNKKKSTGSTAKRILQETLNETKKYDLEDQTNNFPAKNLKNKFDMFKKKPELPKSQKKTTPVHKRKKSNNLNKNIRQKRKRRRNMIKMKHDSTNLRKSKSYKHLFGVVKNSKRRSKISSIKNFSLSQKARSLLNQSPGSESSKMDDLTITPSRLAGIRGKGIEKRNQISRIQKNRKKKKDFASFAREHSSPTLNNPKNKSFLGETGFQKSPYGSPMGSAYDDTLSRKKSRYRCGKVRSGMIKHVSINLIDEENETQVVSPINIKFGMMDNGIYQYSGKKIILDSESGASSPKLEKVRNFGNRFNSKYCRSDNKIQERSPRVQTKMMGKTTRDRRGKDNSGNGNYLTGLIAMARKQPLKNARSPRTNSRLLKERMKTNSVIQVGEESKDWPKEKVKANSFIQRGNLVERNLKILNDDFRTKNPLSTVGSKYLESKTLKKFGKKSRSPREAILSDKNRNIKTRKRLQEKETENSNFDVKSYQIPTNKYITKKIPFNPLIDVTGSFKQEGNCEPENCDEEISEKTPSLIINYKKLMKEPNNYGGDHSFGPGGSKEKQKFENYFKNSKRAGHNQTKKQKLKTLMNNLEGEDHYKEEEENNKDFYTVHDSIMMMHEILRDKVKDIESQISQRGDTESSFY